MMVFYCGSCNKPPHLPAASNASGGKGNNNTRQFMPVRNHMWVRHLISGEHQARVREIRGRWFYNGPRKGSLLDDCSFVVVGVNKFKMFDFAVWCSEFGTLTDFVHYRNQDCAVVTIQGVGVGAIGPGVRRAQSFKNETKHQGRFIRVFSMVEMSDTDLVRVREGNLRNEVLEQNSDLPGQQSEGSQNKRSMRTGHNQNGRADKENRVDKVDGHSRDQSGRVDKTGDRAPHAADRKAYSPLVQVPKENVVEVEAVCKVEEPSLEPTGIVRKEGEPVNDPKLTNGNEGGHVPLVGGHSMRQAGGKNKRRQRYAIDCVIKDAKPVPPLLSIAVNDYNDVDKVAKPDETNAMLTTAPEERKMSEEEGETIEESSLAPVEIVVIREVEKVDGDEEKEAKVEPTSCEEEKSDAVEVKASVKVEEVHGGEEKSDLQQEMGNTTEEDTVLLEEVDVVVVDVEEKKPPAEEKEVKVESAVVDEEKSDTVEIKVNTEEAKACNEVVEVSVEKEQAHSEEDNGAVAEEKVIDEKEKAPSKEDKEDVQEEKVSVEDVKGNVDKEKAPSKVDKEDVLEEKVSVAEVERNVNKEKVCCENDEAEVSEVKANSGAGEGKKDSATFSRKTSYPAAIKGKEKKANAEATKGDEVKADIGEEKTKGEQKSVPPSKEKAKEEKEQYVPREEGNADADEVDYMAYAMYWYRF